METVLKSKNLSLAQRVGLVVVSIFFALLCNFVLSSNPIWAAGGGSGDPPPIDVGGGAGNPPASGIGTDTPNTPNPADTSNYKENPAGTARADVGCSDWSGSPTWIMAASCKFTSDKVVSGFSGLPGVDYGWGQDIHGRPVTRISILNVPCEANGNKSAYARTWFRDSVDYYKLTGTYRWNKDFGWVISFTVKLIGQMPTYSPEGCIYPSTQYSQVTCFWNYNGNSLYSIDRNVNIAGWTDFGKRGSIAGDPREPTGGSGTTAPSCDRTGSANVYFRTNVKDYGYYRMYVDWTQRTYYKEAWVIWGNQEVYANWTRGSAMPGYATTFWTYTCSPGQSNALQGPWNYQNQLPNVDRYTNPATCPQVIWQCKAQTPTTIALDRASVLSGTVSPTSKASVMRNGEKVNIDFARIRIIDTSTPADIDVTDGGSSPGVRNVTNISYNTTVGGNSTPFYGTNPNGSGQYFKYYASRSTNTLEKFGMWLSNNNANLDKSISFTWAGDAGKPFTLQRIYRVSAEFYVPGGSSIGSGGVGAPASYVWKAGTYDCRDYSGRGVSRVDLGPLVVTSNPVDVVRSVNK